jgi:hypothetical protein
MRNDKLIEIIINKAITRINFLLPKTKKIIIKNFKIKNNKLFDSLNYVTFLIEVDKECKKKFSKKINLFDQKPFLDKNHLKKFLLKKLS